MKPFDLEAAKRGEPIVTRDGREAKFIAHVPEANEIQKIVVSVDKGLISLRQNGRTWKDTDTRSDLFMAPKKRTVWVNLYSDGEAFYHYTQEEADDLDSGAKEDRIGGKAYPVEIEE